MSDCRNCSNLQAEINRLQIENARLAKRVKQLEAEVYRLQSTIHGICRWCYQVAQDCAARMKNISKAEYAFLKGKYEVSSAIYNTLRGE